MTYFNKLSTLFSSGSLCDETLKRAEVFRFVDPVRHDYRYQLRYAGEQKVGMKGLCILCLAVSETETVFDVIDGALNGCADLIG